MKVQIPSWIYARARSSILTCIFLSGTSAITPVFAKPAPHAPPPAAVIQAVAKVMRGEDGSYRGRPPAKMFRAVDVNGDGIPDWIANFEFAPGGGWCGTGGCRQMIFVRQPSNNYQLVFDMQSREFAARSMPRGFRIDVDVHGSNCGSYGADECALSFVWDRAQARFVEAPNRHKSTRISAGMLNHTEPLVPPAAAVAAFTSNCPKAKIETGDISEYVFSVPDLDGDGIRDWIVNYKTCDDGASDKPLDTDIFLSSAPGASTITFHGHRAQIDISHKPAWLVELLVDDAEFDTVPAERIYRWNTSTKTFDKSAEHPAHPRTHK